MGLWPQSGIFWLFGETKTTHVVVESRLRGYFENMTCVRPEMYGKNDTETFRAARAAAKHVSVLLPFPTHRCHFIAGRVGFGYEI